MKRIVSYMRVNWINVIAFICLAIGIFYQQLAQADLGLQPGEQIGDIDCEFPRTTKCMYKAGFTDPGIELPYIDYVKKRTGLQNVRIIGIQKYERSQGLVLFFAWKP